MNVETQRVVQQLWMCAVAYCQHIDANYAREQIVTRQEGGARRRAGELAGLLETAYPAFLGKDQRALLTVSVRMLADRTDGQ